MYEDVRPSIVKLYNARLHRVVLSYPLNQPLIPNYAAGLRNDRSRRSGTSMAFQRAAALYLLSRCASAGALFYSARPFCILQAAALAVDLFAPWERV